MASPVKRYPRRGVTMTEVVVSIAVTTIGMVGMAQMQIVGVRSNQFSRSMANASSLARDFAENVSLWAYNDPRLEPLATISSWTDARIAKAVNPGRADVLETAARLQYSEAASDANAVTAGALGTPGGAGVGAYDGTSADLDKDGKLDFKRYWTVLAIDTDGDTVPNGKFVVIVVRWREPGFGMRRIVMTQFKTNEGVYAL